MWTDRVTLTGEVGAGEWIRGRLTGWEKATGVIPTGFAAYARILHPVPVDPVETAPGKYTQQYCSWSEIAEKTGRIIHPAVQFSALIGASQPGKTSSDEWDDAAPSEGNLPPRETAALCDIAARHTSTPQDAYFAVWEGWGQLNGGSVAFGIDERGRPWQRRIPPLLSYRERRVPRLELPDRSYHLFRGPLDAIEALSQMEEGDHSWQVPSLWWPADRAWCVASEIDFDSTLVGGSAALIAEVLASPDLEALPLDPDTDLTWTGDRINV